MARVLGGLSGAVVRPVTDAAGGGAPGDFTTKSLDFDGSTEYVNIPVDANIGSGITSALTLSVWVKVDTLVTAMAFFNHYDGTDNNVKWRLMLNNTGGEARPWIRLSDDGVNLDQSWKTGGSDSDLNDGAWHHVAMVYDQSQAAANEVTFYTDGAVRTKIQTDGAPNLDTGNLFNTSKDILLGASNNASVASYFNGRLTDWAMFNAALNATDISNIYNSGKPNDLTSHAKAANLVGYWRPDTSTSPTLSDESGNSNDGTFNNMDASNIVSDAP